VCVREHHNINDNALTNFSMNGYKMATGYSHKIYKNAGVCNLVKGNILYQAVDLHSICKEETLRHVL